MNPGQELSSIDFQSMIGGPLCAVVEAQAQSAMSTINFIKTVGFKPGDSTGDPLADSNTGDPINVEFKYKKEMPKPDGTTEIKDATLTVPILTIVPIPYLRVEETTIDFIAKITATEYRNVDTSMKIDASLEAKAGFLFASAKLKTSFSYQRNTREGNNVSRDYSLQVKVRAVQEEIPGGMAKVLNLLESAIKEKVD